MKNILLASTALVMSAGYAAADVAVGGDGRMGVVYTESADNDNEFVFNSRIRISFTATGQTDGGLEFGGSVRADNAGPNTVASTITDANGLAPGDVGFDPASIQIANSSSAGGVNGIAGSVFASGAFGKLSMGDVDGGAQAVLGHVSGVGYTGIGDFNEIGYISNAVDETVLYQYTAGAVGFAASIDQIGDDDTNIGLGVSYATGAYKFGIGYEDAESLGSHVVLGADAGFGAFTVKARFGTFDGDDDNNDFDQFAVSLDYNMDALTVTGFVADMDMDLDLNDDIFDNDDDSLRFGIGAAYDLGGGAALKGGIVHTGQDGDNDVRADFGMTMSF